MIKLKLTKFTTFWCINIVLLIIILSITVKPIVRRFYNNSQTPLQLINLAQIF